MNIYARISYKHYLNSKCEKGFAHYRLIDKGGLVWERVILVGIDITHIFYVNNPTLTTYIPFEEWHLTKLATRYHKYKEINKERQNEISNRPT